MPEPTPTEYLPALSGIPPTGVRHKAGTFELIRQSLKPSHTLHNYITRPMAKRRLQAKKHSLMKHKPY